MHTLSSRPYRTPSSGGDPVPASNFIHEPTMAAPRIAIDIHEQNIRVETSYGHSVVKRRCRLMKRHPVLSDIISRLVWRPFNLHAPILLSMIVKAARRTQRQRTHAVRWRDGIARFALKIGVKGNGVSWIGRSFWS